MKAIDAKHYLIRASIDQADLPNHTEYPYSLPIIKQFKSLEFHPHVTFIVGENGSGKSTLLESLAIGMGFNAEGGSRNFHFSTKDSHSNLYEYIRLVKGIYRPKDGYFLRAESFYNVASEIENLDQDPFGGPPITASYGGISLHEQSHGESFISLMEHRFRGNGLYILDEPEAALSPARQFKLIQLLRKHIDMGAQFIIATHSPIIMGYPDAAIFLVNDEGIAKVSYKETEHYRLTKRFLDNRQDILDELLN